MGFKKDFGEFGEYMLPVAGDIKIHKIGKELTNSKLERIVFDAVFIGLKYLAYYWIANQTINTINNFYTWQATSDILKGI